MGLDKNRLVDIPRLNEKFALPQFEADAQYIADRGVTLLRNVCISLCRSMLRGLCAFCSSHFPPIPTPIRARPLKAKSAGAWTRSRRCARTRNLFMQTLSNFRRRTLTTSPVAALFVRVSDRKGNVSFPDEQRAFVDQLLAGGKPCVVLSFGSPYLSQRFPAAKTWIGEFSTNDVSQRAAVRALFGQVAIEGHIPVTVPGTVKRGDGLTVSANPMRAICPRPPQPPCDLRRHLHCSIAQWLTVRSPAGCSLSGYKDQLTVHPFGKISGDAKAAAVQTNTIYDVASLTKPIVTTTSVMILVQQKRLDLDAPLSRFLPEWSAATKSDPDPHWRAQVTPRMLLLHDSGLPAHRDFYKDAKGHDAVLARVLAEPLVHEPGKQVEYSDLGFILLGEIVERLTGESLEEFAKKEIFSPLGMASSMFNPPPSLRARIAPTENDTTYRKRLIQGEVHDQNAWAMGGIAGDAGLFSTAGDVADFAQMILNGGIYAHHRVVSRATVANFTAHEAVGNSMRTLGWDVPLDPSATGRYFSPHSFGHYGFTGTSLWIDPDRDLFIILLTNRVNPSVENIKIRQVRPALHDSIFEALGVTSRPVASR